MKVTRAELKRIIAEEYQKIQAEEAGEGGKKEVMYSVAKRRIEEALNTLWDELDSAGVPNAQDELNKLITHIQRDMDNGFIGEPT